MTTIGLFGTCGGSTWRDEFIRTYKVANIDYFNPDAGDNWHPGMIAEENKHLKEDKVILFPVLAETTGTGSLGEIGFSVLNVVRNIMFGSDQTLVVLIDDECTVEDPSLAKESNRARKLVKSKLAEIQHPNIFLVEDLDSMLKLSLRLYHLYEDKGFIDRTFRPEVKSA